MFKTDPNAVPAKHPMTEEQRADELRCITDFYGWPTFPFFHVKQPMTTGWPAMGVLYFDIDTDKAEPIIYDFSPHAGGLFDQTKIVAKYESFEAMLDDGWICD